MKFEWIKNDESSSLFILWLTSWFFCLQPRPNKKQSKKKQTNKQNNNGGSWEAAAGLGAGQGVRFGFRPSVLWRFAFDWGHFFFTPSFLFLLFFFSRGRPGRKWVNQWPPPVRVPVTSPSRFVSYFFCLFFFYFSWSLVYLRFFLSFFLKPRRAVGGWVGGRNSFIRVDSLNGPARGKLNART